MTTNHIEKYPKNNLNMYNNVQIALVYAEDCLVHIRLASFARCIVMTIR